MPPLECTRTSIKIITSLLVVISLFIIVWSIECPPFHSLLSPCVMCSDVQDLVFEVSPICPFGSSDYFYALHLHSPSFFSWIVYISDKSRGRLCSLIHIITYFMGVFIIVCITGRSTIDLVLVNRNLQVLS